MRATKFTCRCGSMRSASSEAVLLETIKDFTCICHTENPSARTPHIMSGRVLACAFLKAPPFLRSKCAVRTTMARQQSAPCKQNALTISPVAPWSCGTWICSARMSLRSIGPVILSTRQPIGVAIWLKRNLLPQDGACPSMIFLRKSEDVIYCPHIWHVRKMDQHSIQYISDEEGNPTGV